jgi:flagellar hook-associated protein 1 FlgK
LGQGAVGAPDRQPSQIRLPVHGRLDQREQLVQQLGQQVGVTVLPAANGTLDIYTAAGAALVNGTNSFLLSVGAGVYGDGSPAITYAASGQDVTNSLSGGAIGGLLVSRTQVTDAENRTGAIAAELVGAANTQQSLGLDLNGELGQALFAVAAPTVYTAATNTGGGQLTAAITDPAQFSPGDFIVKKTAGGFEATNMATSETTALGSGPTLSFNGMMLTMSGTIPDGDSFKLRPTAEAAATIAVTASDPRKIAAAAPYVVTAGPADSDGNVTGPNQGTISATASGPVASGSLPGGALVLPATAFGQTLSVTFTSATDFEVRTGGGTVLASGSASSSAETQIAIPMPPPAPAGWTPFG